MKKPKSSKTKSSKTYQQFYAHVHSKAVRPRSRVAYLNWVARLGEHYEPKGPGLRRLSERQVLDYLIYLRDDQKLAASTVNQALVPIRTLYRDVLQRDWKLWSQFELQRREPLPTVLSREEVRRVLASVHEGRFKALLAIIYHCGLRLSEALNLKPTDIDSTRGVVRVRREIEAMSGGIGNPAFRQALEAEYTAKQIQLADAEKLYGENHPDVQNLRRSLGALREQLAQLPKDSRNLPEPNNPVYVNLELQLKSVNIELDALQNDRRELQAETSELDEAIQIAPEVERRYLELTRDLEIARQQYEDTMARRMAVERAGALEASDVAERYVVTRAPGLPLKPAFPNRPLIIIISIFAGLTAGLGAAIAAEVLDDSIRNTRDVRTIIGVPPIAAIPVIRTESEYRTITRNRRLSFLALGALVILVAIYAQLQISGTI